MTVLAVVALLGAGCSLLFTVRRRPAAVQPTLRRKRRRKPDPWLLPMVVYQLAALLEAGRSPQVIWDEVCRAHSPPPRGRGGSDLGEATELEVVQVLRAADRAAALGHSVAPVLRRYSRVPIPGLRGPRDAGQRHRRVWLELANCWDVAEISGAPLAKLLNRYAGSLETELDAEAARLSALAGPRATVTLLSWLPLFGLGLGMLMGVEPLAVLLGTPIGLGALVLGLALMILGRQWSRAMVAAAGRDG